MTSIKRLLDSVVLHVVAYVTAAIIMQRELVRR
jgi:hypothetical protein